jgi:hypothetical protein
MPIQSGGHWENNRGHSSMQINQQKAVQVDVTELQLHIKVRDGFTGALKDAQGELVGAYIGYVPDFFPGQHYGDYLLLNIDLETGQIKNWRKPVAADIEKMIEASDDD